MKNSQQIIVPLSLKHETCGANAMIMVARNGTPSHAGDRDVMGMTKATTHRPGGYGQSAGAAGNKLAFPRHRVGAQI